MPHSLAREIVIPALDDFYRRYPEVSLALSANDAAINLIHEGVDCVVRAWQIGDDSLAAHRLPALRQITCASAGYLAAHGAPASPDALDGHHVVGYFSLRDEQRYPLEFMVKGKLITRDLPGRLMVNGADAYVAAGRAGLGLIQAPRYGLRGWLESGELVEVLSDAPPPPMPLFVMYPQGRFLAPRVRALINWLDECFRRCPDIVE